MESIEDDVILPIPHEPLFYKPKLKRLKKSSSSAAADSVRVYEAPIVPNEDSEESAASESKDLDEKVDFGDDLNPLFSVPSDDPTFPSSDSPISGSKEVVGEKEADGDLDPLFSVPAADEGFETLDLERESEEDGGFKNTGDIESGVEKEKSVKKRLNMDEGSEEISKKRRKKKSKDADKLGEKPKESVREKKRTEKVVFFKKKFTLLFIKNLFFPPL